MAFRVIHAPLWPGRESGVNPLPSFITFTSGFGGPDKEASGELFVQVVASRCVSPTFYEQTGTAFDGQANASEPRNRGVVKFLLNTKLLSHLDGPSTAGKHEANLKPCAPTHVNRGK